MDSFQFVNIFDTKGIEYILVIGFMAAFYAFVRLIAPNKKSVSGALAHEGHMAPLEMNNPLQIPEGFFLAPGHSSARLVPDGTLAMGAGVLPKHLLGSFDKIDILKKSTVKAGETLAVLHGAGRSITLQAPADGDIAEINNELSAHPEAYQADSWLVRLQPNKLQDALGNMRFAADAKSWLDDEMVRMRDVLATLPGQETGGAVAMADGGMPVKGLATEMSADNWASFEKRFFDTKG